MNNGNAAQTKKKGVVCMTALLTSYFMTAVMLLILALLLYKTNLEESKVAAGILITYIVSGKGIAAKKYLWGLGVGVLYFLILIGISAVSGRILLQEGLHLFTTMILCAGSGMMGGMLS